MSGISRPKHLRVFSVASLSAFALAACIFARPHSTWSQTGGGTKAPWTEKERSEIEKSKSATDITAMATALNNVFINLAKGLSPAVVNIYTRTRIMPPQYASRGMPPEDLFRFFFGNPFNGDMGGRPMPREAQALGSGFVINADGVIITNSHVVRMSGRNADQIMIKFKDENPESKGHEARVLGVDERTDVAVIQLKQKKKDIVFAPLGNSDKAQVGERVAAIGNPYGHTNSFTTGGVSAVGRSLDTPPGEGPQITDFIQTDASINPGNSGGPLINIYGEVIGINTAIDARAQGIGFAIPINTAKRVIRQIIEKGEVVTGWIGVAISSVAPVAKSLGLPAEQPGAFIQDVVPNEPADKGGMKPYDIVIEVNGTKIDSARKFSQMIAEMAVGTKAAVTVLRDQGDEKRHNWKPLKLAINIGKRKSEAEVAKERGQMAPKGNKSGMRLGELTPAIREELGLPGGVSGVVVQAVAPRSLAAAVGLQPGDVITRIDRKLVRNVREAEKALNSSKAPLLQVRRGNETRIVPLDSSLLEGQNGDEGPSPEDDNG